MRIAVIEHIQKDRDWLSLCFKEYLKVHEIPGKVYGYPGREAFLEAHGKLCGLSYDLVFLDICADGKSGLEAARQLRLKNAACSIVLMADTDRFAIEGYRVRALRYLLKPWTLPQVEEALDAFFSRCELCGPCLEVREDRMIKKVYLQDVKMIELQGHYVIFYTQNGDGAIKARMTGRELAERVRDKRFLECSRNLLVNMDYVERVDEGETGWEAFYMKDGRKALIQKIRKKQVRQRFTEYLSQKAGRTLRFMPETCEFCQNRADDSQL